MSSQMVLKHRVMQVIELLCFRSMSSQMVLKLSESYNQAIEVLDLCHLKWY